MVKYLDHSLSVHSLFHKAGHISQRHLLTDKEFAAVAADESGNGKHYENDHHCQNRQQRAENDHGNKGNNNCKKRHQRLGDRLADHLTQRICIVGVKAHDRTVGPLVKIADRQGLHMFEHIVPHFFQDALSDINHHSGVSKGRRHSHKEDTGKNRKRAVKSGKIRSLLPDQRNDKVVQKELQRQRNGNRTDGA